MIPPLWQKAKRTNKTRDEVKEENEKVGLKLNIQKTKVMVSNPITSCPMDGKKMEIVKNFILLGSKNHRRWWLQPWN